MIAKLTFLMLCQVAGIGALLFVPAGTVRWPAAWILLLETGGLGFVIGLWLARHDPALLAERMSVFRQPDQKLWDKFLLPVLVVLWGGWLVAMGRDAARRAARPHAFAMPVAAQVAGALCIIICMWICFLTFRENSYAAPVVKIQAGRGQTVVTTGPYRYVRHPMYAGVLFFFVGAPLLLGSWLGLALAPVLAAVLAFRAILEERTLRAELAGYTEYAARVRYRLIPGIW
jgi:protein-S-isoprenylcysteine O-methyltransferase Ste14